MTTQATSAKQTAAGEPAASPPRKRSTAAARQAVLVEVAFITNAQEEGRLKSGEFLDKAAGAIGTAIRNYLKLRGEIVNDH